MGGLVGIDSSAVLQPVKDPPQRPHSLVKMRVKMTVEDRVADHAVETARAVQDIQRVAFLRADGDVLGRVGRVGVVLERQTVAHRLGTVADGRGAVWKSGVWVHRLAAVRCADLQLVVEKHGVFPEGRLRRMVNVSEQAAVQRLSRHRVKPG